MNPSSFETNPPNFTARQFTLSTSQRRPYAARVGHAVVVLLDGKQTGEKFTAFLNISPPGCGPGPHYHEREDEWFYIVEGQVSFLMNGTWTDVFPGDCIYSPRGSVHAFKNNTDQPIRVFMNIAPAGFERFFAEVAEEWARPEPDMSRITAISEKYGIHSA